MIKLLKEALEPTNHIDTGKYDKYFDTPAKKYKFTCLKFSDLTPEVQSSFAPVLDGLIASPKFKNLKIYDAGKYERIDIVRMKTTNNFFIEIIYRNSGKLKGMLSRIMVYRQGGDEVYHPSEWVHLNYDPKRLVMWINDQAEKLERRFVNKEKRQRND